MRSILRNTTWNVVGNVSPALSALFAIPFLTRTIGTDLFGALSIVWILIGYFSFFDFGISRAATKVVAELEDQRGRRCEVAATSLALITLIGIGAALFLTFLIFGILLLSPTTAEAFGPYRSSAYLVIACIPVVVMTSGIRGILEGLQDFRALNLIRVPTGILFFLMPCLFAYLSPTLAMATAGLVAARFIGFGLHAALLITRMPLRPFLRPSFANLHSFVSFGGWLTVSSFVGPIILYIDRALITARLSTAELAYYTAPFEALSRLLILPTSFTAALFPQLSVQAHRDKASAWRLSLRATWLTAIGIVPITVAGVMLCSYLLTLWLGPAFAEKSTNLTLILLIGFAANSLAQIPYSALQSLGHTKEPALLHIAELPIYLFLAWTLITEYGLEGAATAWTIRAAVDMALMFVLARKYFDRS